MQVQKIRDLLNILLIDFNHISAVGIRYESREMEMDTSEIHRARFSLNRATSHSAMLKKRGKEVKDISTCSRVRIQLVCRNSGWFDPDLMNCGFDGRI